MKIYYAHHLWKYGTPIEDYEIECIKKKFEDAEIINPRTLLPQDKPESEIMQLAYDTIKGCDVLVFSTVSGMIGHGVFNEIAVAVNSGISIYQFEGNTCYEMKDVDLKDIVFQGDNRVYALVRIPYEYQEDTDW
jgi:hypothetical protein